MLLRSDFWPPIKGGWHSLSGVLVLADEVIAAFAEVGITGHPEERPDSESDETDVHHFVRDRANEYHAPAPTEVFVFPDDNRFRGFEPSSSGVYLHWSEQDWSTSARLRNLFSKRKVYGPLTFAYRARYHIPPGAEFIMLIVGLVLIVMIVWVLSRC